MGYEIRSIELNANTGNAQNCENTQVAPSRLILTPRSMSIATETLARTLSTWTTLTKASEPNRIKPLPVAENIIPEDQEDIMKDRPFLGGKKIVSGKQGMTFELDVNQNYINELMKLNNKKWSCFLCDPNGWIEGITTDDTKFEPIECLSVQVMNVKTPEANQNKVCRVKVVLGDTDKKRVVINPTQNSELGYALTDWNPASEDDLDGVHNVVLTAVGNWSATGGIVDVKYQNSGAGVSGLVSADFAIQGEVISATESTTIPGRYTITGTTIASGSINLVACASISLSTVAIESTGAASFTVV